MSSFRPTSLTAQATRLNGGYMAWLKRTAEVNWPFMVGFGIWGLITLKIGSNITADTLQKSHYWQQHQQWDKKKKEHD